jgi:hypothetical protein
MKPCSEPVPGRNGTYYAEFFAPKERDRHANSVAKGE